LQKRLTYRLSNSLYNTTNKNTVIETLKYMFFKMRTGIFVSIRDNKVRLFVPFVNLEYRNNYPNEESFWVSSGEYPGGIEQYQKEKGRYATVGIRGFRHET